MMLPLYLISITRRIKFKYGLFIKTQSFNTYSIYSSLIKHNTKQTVTAIILNLFKKNT